MRSFTAITTTGTDSGDESQAPPAEDKTGARKSPLDLRVMGRLEINGNRSRSTKPIEFVTAIVMGGGRLSRDALERYIYRDSASYAAIPTLCYRARQLGFSIEFDAHANAYHLTDAVTVDALCILHDIAEGNLTQALSRWIGPALAASHTPLAKGLRHKLTENISKAALATQDQRLIRQVAHITDAPQLIRLLEPNDPFDLTLTPRLPMAAAS